MSTSLVCVQFWLPAAQQDELGDALLDWPGRIAVMYQFEGRALGHEVTLRAAQDRVRGSTAQAGVQVQVQADQLDALIDHLKRRRVLAGLSWTATAVLASGSLT